MFEWVCVCRCVCVGGCVRVSVYVLSVVASLEMQTLTNSWMFWKASILNKIWNRQFSYKPNNEFKRVNLHLNLSANIFSKYKNAFLYSSEAITFISNDSFSDDVISFFSYNEERKQLSQHQKKPNVFGRPVILFQSFHSRKCFI